MSGVTCPGPSRLPWYGWAGSCRIGPRPIPAGGSNQWTPKASQAKLIDARLGILALGGVWALAPVAAAHSATLAHNAAAQEVRFLDAIRLRWMANASFDIIVFLPSDDERMPLPAPVGATLVVARRAHCVSRQRGDHKGRPYWVRRSSPNTDTVLWL